MTKYLSLVWLCGLLCFLPVYGQAQEAPKVRETIPTIDGKTVRIKELDTFIPELMKKAKVTGMQIAIVSDGEVAYSRGFGVRSKATGDPIKPATDFYAASFSKTVFAYLVMQLVDEGVLDLDKPLYTYLKKPLYEYDFYKDMKDDDRYKRITARLVLSHQTGWPNYRWLNENAKLDFKADPGTRFGYSGEGINYLQFVVEEVTGKGLDELSREKVFKPLGMTRTRYVWDTSFAQDYALGHDEKEALIGKKKRTTANAAGSMDTTAEDYARFLIAVASSKGLKLTSRQEMLRPQVTILSRAMFGPLSLQTSDQNKAIQLGWGLGWGVFTTPYGPAYFHGGHDDGWNHYNVTYPEKKLSIIILTNSSNGESMMQELLKRTIGDTYSPASWFGWVPYEAGK